MIDATRQMRWYVGLGMLFLALAPLLMFTLLVTKTDGPPGYGTPLLVGAPINLVGAVLVVQAMRTTDPSRSSRLLAIGAAVVIVGDVVLFGLRSLLA